MICMFCKSDESEHDTETKLCPVFSKRKHKTADPDGKMIEAKIRVGFGIAKFKSCAHVKTKSKRGWGLDLGKDIEVITRTCVTCGDVV